MKCKPQDRAKDYWTVEDGVVVTDYDGAGVLDDATHRARQVGECGHLALQIHTGDRLRIRSKDLQIQGL